MTDSDLHSKKISPSDAKTRAFIGVQNGCDHRCTFCIIPYARGNSRSLTEREINEQIKELVDQGIKEVILTGVDITSWGADLAKRQTFGDLIESIFDKNPQLPRLRLSSIDSVEVDQKLFELIARERKVMPHLHLSLQSGDNLILKRMKRRHTREVAIDFCTELKKTRPEISLSADIIAGFPTETTHMFNNTLSLLEECHLNWLHVFPFSARPGTPAARMPQVSKSVIEYRAAALRSESSKKLNTHLVSKLGRIEHVLVEVGCRGFTEDFTKVQFPSGMKVGEIIPMKITGQHNNELLGSPTYQK